MSDVYVLGVDMIKFGRFPDRSVPNIGAEAALMALDDAGLTIKDMQAMYCGNLGQANAMVGQRILQEIGQQEFLSLIVQMHVLLEQPLLEKLGCQLKLECMMLF